MEKKYANTCGTPISKVKVVTFSGAMSILDDVRRSGKVFRADFRKKDGKMRTMVCRCGVKVHLTGGGAKYSFKDKGLLSVFEFGTGYRTIRLDELHIIKIGGVLYDFRTLNGFAPTFAFGEYPITGKHTGRTMAAHTSPMYKVA